MTIICYVEKPLQIEPQVFDRVDLSDYVLCIPVGCAEAYRNADVWKDFGDIREVDVTAITEKVAINTTAYSIFNLHGQKVDGNYRGIVVRNGKKVMVK